MKKKKPVQISNATLYLGPKQSMAALEEEYANYSIGLEIIRLNRTLENLKEEHQRKTQLENTPKRHSLKEKNIAFD